MKERSVFIPREAVQTLLLLDGSRNVRDIQYEISRQTSQIVMSTEIESFIKTLEENFLLEGEKYDEWLAKLREEYRSLAVRPASMAGTAYPADKGELTRYLDEILNSESYIPADKDLPENLKGFVAPHIDIERGKGVYLRVYQCVRKYPPADSYVILGVNHNFPSAQCFIGTGKDFETPLGVARIDHDLLKPLKERVSGDLFKDELAHGGEHSVEFHVLFLQHVYPAHNLYILPILCNFNERTDPGVDEFISTLKEVIASSKKNVVLIASVDFSHIGPQFGWERQVDRADVARVRHQDEETLRLLALNRADEFYDNIASNDNPRNIDALQACYTFLNLVEPATGLLIHYEEAYHPQNTVTFAGLLF